MTKQTYVVAGCKSWNRSVFDDVISLLPGRWIFIDRADELTLSTAQSHNPRYIFFLHWSWKVPDEIVRNYECVCFHMTDLPYGRGGSPLQNLIIRGHRQTKLSAFRMTAEIDAGPIYMKEELSLQGSAQEIYTRASDLSAQMIEQIVRDQPKPTPQAGDIIQFSRRKPAESVIPETASLETLYDFIRMLDAEGYPPAFLVHNGYRYDFNRAVLHEDKVTAEVTIRPEKKN